MALATRRHFARQHLLVTVRSRLAWSSPLHGSGELGNRAGPLALAHRDFMWIVHETLSGERLEECDCFLFVLVHAVDRRLIRPSHKCTFE
jgi:hypothetical protein